MAKQHLDWIFFDLDDTLIPSSEIYEKCYAEMGLLKDRLFAKAKLNVKKTITQGHTSVHNRILYFKEYLRLKGKCNAHETLKMNSRYEKLLFKAIVAYVKKSQRQKILKRLAVKYNLAIVTNETCRSQMIKISALDPTGTIFKTIVTSEEVGVEKPSYQIFKKTLERSNARPNQVCFVGDSLENDVQPAFNFGMTPVHTIEFRNQGKQRTLSKKYRVIQHIDELDK